MSLAPGSRLGPYDIVAPLGAGGMGEVYRARDTRLGRDVAIKIMPADVARDADRRARFENEARAVAALSHANILAIYDIGVDGDQLYVVTELLDGESLADRLAAGALPMRKATETAIAIARGLSAAHGKGIVHRDLKPANVFLLADGQVKILDFGLAREMAGPTSGATETKAALTDPGTILGTAGYMAPEQVRGQHVDGRADLFALGVVLYEMLTGQRAFARETTAETLTAILREDPPEITAAGLELPPALDRIVRHCLEKSPVERFQTARDVIFALETLSGSATVPGTAVGVGRRSSRRRLLAASALAGSLVIGAVAGWWFAVQRMPKAVAPPIMRFESGGVSPANDFAAPAVSPDGRSIAFISASGDSVGRVFVHSLADGRATELPGTERAQRPAWSRDGKWVAFFKDSKLFKVSLDGSPPIALCEVPTYVPEGASVAWGAHDLLIFSPNLTGVIHAVGASGGAARAVTALDASQQETGHSWPAFLPDGERFVYSATRRGASTRALMVASTSAGLPPRRVMDVDSSAVPVDGHLLHMAQRTLVAQPVDLATLALRGTAFVVSQQVSLYDTGRSFHAAGNVIVTMRSNRSSTLDWFDRSGRAIERVRLPGRAGWPDIAPDGRRIAIDIHNELGFREVWLIDGDRQTRVAFGEQQYMSDVVWSPDGRRVAFAYDTGREIHEVTVGEPGSKALTAFKASTDHAYPTDWSRDGRYIAYSSWVGGSGGLWLLPLTGGTGPLAVVDTPFMEGQGRFSPDSRFIAYTTNSSGRPEVVTELLPPSKGRWPVSTQGGAQPMWRGDGRELFYLATDGTMMAVPVTLGLPPTFGEPRPLFKTVVEESLFFAVRNHYSVTSDGQRFLINQVRGGYFMEVVVNWQSIAGDR